MGATAVIRSDNGLVFQSWRFREACRHYRLGQEYITPYTPEQNGITEWFFRSLKEECVWLQRFSNYTHARGVVARRLRWYNNGRPHQLLATSARRSIGRDNWQMWLDFGRALH